MFLVVIRSDLKNPLFISDVEPISQTNPTTESPKGQVKYVSRPNRAAIQKYLDAQGLNEITSSTGWTSTDWTGAYNAFTHTTGNTTALSNTLAAVALQVYTLTITITGRTAGTVTATFGGATTGAISVTTTKTFTASTTGALVITPTSTFDGTVAVSVAVEIAAALILATVPSYAGGGVVPTVDISATAIKALIGLSGAKNAQVEAIQNMLGYHFVETDPVKKSVLAGVLHGYLSPNFNPDPRGDLNHPPATAGQAIQVVNDVNHLSTSTTLFTVKSPIITGLTLSGSLTISGSSGGLSGYGLYEPSVVIHGNGARRITQSQILAAGGSVTDTSIVVPAALIAASPTVTTIPATGKTQVRVQVNDMVSNAFAL
jgi:hypothetical protein